MSKRYIILISLIIVSIAPLSSFGGDVHLTWFENGESDLANYRVYYGTSSRDYGPGIPVQGTTEYTVRDLTDNITYYFAVTAVDTSGNESGYSVEAVKTVLPPEDTTPPSISISHPTNGSNYSSTESSIALSGNASDNVGVTEVTWTNSQSGGDGTADGTNNWSVSGISLVDGSNNITITATDAAGNQNSDTITITYTALQEPAPDVTAPNVSITSPTDDDNYISYEPSIKLAGNASDNGEITSITWQNSRGGSGSATFEITTANMLNSRGESGTASDTSSWSIPDISLLEGSNVITLTVTDAADNQSSDALTVNYVLQAEAPDGNLGDDLPPVLDIKSPTQRRWYFTRKSSIKLSGQTTDNEGVTTVSWANSTGEEGDSDFIRGTTNWSTSDIALKRRKLHKITVTASDAAGNVTQESLFVIRW